MLCSYCGEMNSSDTTVCQVCGRSLRKEDSNPEIIILPGSPLPGAPIGGGQPAIGNVAMVQGTPQTSGVPTVGGTPSTVNAPSVEQFSSQGAASTSVQAGSQEGAPSVGQGAPPSASSVEQGASSSAPSTAPSALSPAPDASSPTIGQQTQSVPQPPTHHPTGQPPVHHPTGQPPTHHPSGQPPTHHPIEQPPTHAEPGTLSSYASTAGQHLVSGGKKAARGLLPRTVLLGLVGTAVVVAVAIGAVLYLSHPAAGGSTPNNTVSTTSKSTGNPSKPTSTASTPTSTTATVTSTPDKTVRAFVEAINKKDYPTAYNQFSTHFKSQLSEQQLASTYINSAPIYTVSTTKENSSSASVLFTENDSRCRGGQDTFQLVNENGVWKIDAITVTKVCP